ncbi:MAG: prephenate dehydrogenase/arogenate dehydrogenase family protein [Lachnospiraceae bacterium]
MMKLHSNFRCTFIGLGLIGGSIAKALKYAYPDCCLVAYTRHPEKIQEAVLEGTLDEIFTDMEESVKGSDLIFLCAPVTTNLSNLARIASCIKENALITDVGSVKGNIHEEVKRLHLESHFIGGHPMAGSEKTGYSNASANLLENSFYIITPTQEVSREWIDDYYEMVQSMKAIPILRTPDSHDFATAAVSHVPHLIAGALVQLVMENDTDDAFMKTIAAGGFKDITRIASSSPEMWQSICESNAGNITDLMDRYITLLITLNRAMKEKDFDKIGELFATVGPYRQSITDRSGSTLQRIFRLFVDIPDESGAIAKVASLLASNDINIQNIGITHNREHEQGVLYIEFYEEDAKQKAIPVLEDNHYPVFS